MTRVACFNGVVILSPAEPQAMLAFLKSANPEDAMRSAISLGGDSDTLASITGSISEAEYGIPQEIADQALGDLDSSLRTVYDRWCSTQKAYSPLHI